MTDEKHHAIPKSRLSRFGRFTRLATRVAGGMAAEGVRQLAAGNRPKVEHLLLTPANARRLTSELSKMRGAAMKLGQILSMDGGDIIPPELADILSQLRSDAHTMPAKQLEQQLIANYGKNWQNRFETFELKPVAAASIGQVHRATTKQGDVIALKVQYPGISKSINSDVDNLIGLLRTSGLIPRQLNLKPILDEVKKQLHDEADYQLESEHLQSFGRLLKADKRFTVPKCYPRLTGKTILAMEFIPSVPIEQIKEQPQVERNRVMTALLELFLRELFDMRMVQTDPNFANYRYNPETGCIVLLDFGATRTFNVTLTRHYRSLLKAISIGHDDRMIRAAKNIGYLSDTMSDAYFQTLLCIFSMLSEVFYSTEPYDFKESDLGERLAELNDDLLSHKHEWQLPPTDALYIHRKLGGMFLLASRLDARIAVAPLIKNI